MTEKMDKFIDRANILIEALPYIQRLAGKTVVVKCGGAAMLSEELTQKIIEDITLLKFVGVNPIVVHGGGPEINAMLKKLSIQPEFKNGLRVTDDVTMEVVQMTLIGKTNKDIVSKLNATGAKAIGLSGIDANLIVAEKISDELGNVGEVKSINTKLLGLLADDEYIPVIAPVGISKDGRSLNINADTVASSIAVALKAEKLIFLTDIDGIRTDEKDPESLIYEISIARVRELIEAGVITGGMIPKVDGCMKSVEAGVKRTHILNGTIPHPILLEIFTDSGIGTMVTE